MAEESRAAASRAAAPVARRASSSVSPVKRKSINVINSDDWDANYAALQKFHAKNGNCKVPFGAETGNLRSWTERQKKMYASGQLDDDQLEKMNELDFDCECNVYDMIYMHPINFFAHMMCSSFNLWYTATVTIKPLSPRALSPTQAAATARPAPSPRKEAKKNKPASPQKSLSFKKQKKDYNDLIQEKQEKKKAEEEKLRIAEEEKAKAVAAKAKKPELVRKASVLVIEDDATWNKGYEELKAFHSKTGNTSVPFGKDTGALRSWAERQKKVYAANKLEKSRIEKMEELGFIF